MIDSSRQPRIYFDSNVFIYAIEGDSDFSGYLRRLFVVLRDRYECGVTSELTLAEVLPKTDFAQRRDYFDLLVRSTAFELYPVSREILIDTASYRRSMGMPRLPDAIHVTTVIRSRCQTILSADRRIKVPEGLSLIDTNVANISRLIEELS